MTVLNGKDKPDLNTLAHYGVRGMKWGIRKRYVANKTKGTQILDRVASGKGSVLDKALVGATATPYGLIKNKGFRGEAAARSKELKAHIHRIETGKATVRDKLALYGDTRLTDLRFLVTKTPK